MAEHIEIGKKGELEALNLLKNKGFKILEMNWTYRHLEIDIIAQKGDFLVFVEVKTRSSPDFGEPETFVNRAKQQKLICAANFYFEKSGSSLEARFDVVGVLYKGKNCFIEHLEDAFYPLG